MRAVHENIEGPFAIGEDLAVYGHITQGATLREGVKLILHGTIAGDLIIEPGSRAIIHGTVAGRIYNHGGRVEMFGMADAVENLSPDAATIIDAAAHILRGRRLERSLEDVKAGRVRDADEVFAELRRELAKPQPEAARWEKIQR